ncbi:hypothetical protein FHR83_007044 [Actinoplanes campanulatus]|uniref:Uncharacterized protein n=1 Tax=Actinoplanes campanulatus TaxID=113559 RepID=A0A7W5FI47_9ACTN|nr:hypothetical protein [Actinoplanes campanulatus]MBB3099338.1 hypothetical protein [Actinoplanes campanulatus]GGN40406.1 hypothetical protein GCM10010109_69480 [Actinoplanes campanulatus]GID40655.1 hypothetical protein Aca09nite_71610 [Actinoplanes campanulatus]
MFDRFLNRSQPAGIDPKAATPSPLADRLAEIDTKLDEYRVERPRTPLTRAAMDALLDRRLRLWPGGEGGS